jgi:hypothetical protein
VNGRIDGSQLGRAGEPGAVGREAGDHGPELLPSRIIDQTAVVVEPLRGAADEEGVVEPRPHLQ